MAEPATLNRLVQVRILVPQLYQREISLFSLFQKVEQATPEVEKATLLNCG